MITHEWIFTTDYDLSGIGLIKDASIKYFCTPTNHNVLPVLDRMAFISGFKGHKNPLVYVIAPWSTFYVEPISKNLEDFLSMLLTLKNANFFTFISSSSKEEFLKIGDEDPIPDELLKLIYLSKLVEKRYASLEDVYLAVKKIQSNIELQNV